MDSEYKHIQGKKRVLKEHRKMGVHDRVHKKAQKIEAVKKTLESRGIDTATLEQSVVKRTSLVAKAQKRMKAEEGDKMEDVEMQPGDLKRKAIAKAEKMGFGRAQGMAVDKGVLLYQTLWNRLRIN